MKCLNSFHNSGFKSCISAFQNWAEQNTDNPIFFFLKSMEMTTQQLKNIFYFFYLFCIDT